MTWLPQNTKAVPINYLANLSADLLARAAKIRLAVFDVDGTLTDGRLWYGEDGRETKVFHVHDGLGLKRLQANGVQVALITARISHPVALRAEELDIAHVYQGQGDKRACLQELLDALHLTTEQVAFVGDDLPDLPPMRIAGLAVAVANAHPWVAEAAHWQTTKGGGMGAAREVCDLILHAQGKSVAERERWQ
ncbi:haloacid dehalogenase [Rhodanobacter panaciterrae]|uniref:3-deoxy-D-manno-octulosonate 8-phosphate phosphatase KdsC n=1 Tax=Rhodanobacter panaciterrae TaxID=490572 RepID=A0ABQ3A6E0_9GAMM|nr:haloacid dehalogenase [Rhodanobacter panaciterrae]